MRISTASNRKSFKPSALFSRLCEAIAGWSGGGVTRRSKEPVKVPRRGFGLEMMEPRVLLSSMVYGDPTAIPTPSGLDDVGDYVSAVTSTTFTLKAESDSGGLWWRLYGTGLDGTATPTQVAQLQISSAADLDLDLKRDDLGLANDTISLIDFIGDTISTDLD
ncbi:MAG: hypothetical protein JNM98_03285, partial [Rhodocyclaceae bacterium]|nr:hypothetical protein [Rhodocyclaceae bacterium]